MGVYIELPKEWAKWSLDVRDIHDNDLEAKVTDIDLVRCGECKHQIKQWHEDNRMKSKGFYYYHCDRNEDPFVAHTVNGEPTDFCSYGERRTDE